MNDKDIVVNKFKIFKEKFNEVTDYVNFEEKIEFLHDWLFDKIKECHSDIINEIKSLDDKPNFITAEIDNWIENLQAQIEIKSSSSNKIKKKLASYIFEFVQDLKEYQLRIIDNTQLSLINRRLPKINESNKSILSRKDTLLLMLLLRDSKVFNKDVSTGLLADCMGALVGFSGKQLENEFQDLQSHRIGITEDDLSKLKKTLLDVHDSIEMHFNKFK